MFPPVNKNSQGRAERIILRKEVNPQEGSVFLPVWLF